MVWKLCHLIICDNSDVEIEALKAFLNSEYIAILIFKSTDNIVCDILNLNRLYW